MHRLLIPIVMILICGILLISAITRLKAWTTPQHVAAAASPSSALPVAGVTDDPSYDPTDTEHDHLRAWFWGEKYTLPEGRPVLVRVRYPAGDNDYYFGARFIFDQPGERYSVIDPTTNRKLWDYPPSDSGDGVHDINLNAIKMVSTQGDLTMRVKWVRISTH
jgi:hypothetical protein